MLLDTTRAGDQDTPKFGNSVALLDGDQGPAVSSMIGIPSLLFGAASDGGGESGHGVACAGSGGGVEIAGGFQAG